MSGGHVIWVAASAGSGKTTRLVDRVISLLLFYDIHPGHILCLTFTEVAAKEIQQRVEHKVRQISQIKCDQELLVIINKYYLNNIYGAKYGFINNYICKKARSLYAIILFNQPRIGTIHGFCYQQLANQIRSHFRRYSLIAPSNSKAICRDILFKKYIKLMDEPYKYMAIVDITLDDLIPLIIKYNQTQKINDERKDDFNDLIDRAFSLLIEMCNESFLSNIDILINILKQATEFDIGKYQNIVIQLMSWVDSDLNKRLFSHQILHDIFINTLDQPKRISWPIIKDFPNLILIIKNIQLTLIQYKKKIFAAVNKIRAVIINRLVIDVSVEYRVYKDTNNFLDYDDLMHRTHDLLANDDDFRFKLLRGIKHILVDEAQDNSKIQWQIIKMIAKEILSCVDNSSLFVVGDPKQSIYRFQDADPALFWDMANYMKKLINSDSALVEENFFFIESSICYRMSDNLLHFLNQVIDCNNLYSHLIVNKMEHVSGINRVGGLIQLHVLCSDNITSNNNDESSCLANDKHKLLSQTIVKDIKQWLAHGRIVEGKTQNVFVDDIMILVRHKSDLIECLMSDLRNEDIACNYRGNVELNALPLIRKMIYFFNWIFDVSDIMSLFIILKSSIFGFNENELAQIYDKINDIINAINQSTSLNNKEHMIDIVNSLQLASNYGALKIVPDDVEIVDRFIAALSILIDIREKFVPLDRNNLAIWPMRLSHFCHYVLIDCDWCRFLASNKGDHKLLMTFIDQLGILEAQYKYDLTKVLFHLNNDALECNIDVSCGVTISTVHGAKGTEGNIVILPDMQNVPKLHDKIANLDNFIVYLDKKYEVTDRMRDLIRDEQYDEYIRLLYVALSRSRSELHMYGVVKHCYWKDYVDNCIDIKEKNSYIIDYDAIKNPNDLDIIVLQQMANDYYKSPENQNWFSLIIRTMLAHHLSLTVDA